MSTDKPKKPKRRNQSSFIALKIALAAQEHRLIGVLADLRKQNLGIKEIKELVFSHAGGASWNVYDNFGHSIEREVGENMYFEVPNGFAALIWKHLIQNGGGTADAICDEENKYRVIITNLDEAFQSLREKLSAIFENYVNLFTLTKAFVNDEQVRAALRILRELEQNTGFLPSEDSRIRRDQLLDRLLLTIQKRKQELEGKTKELQDVKTQLSNDEATLKQQKTEIDKIELAIRTISSRSQKATPDEAKALEEKKAGLLKQLDALKKEADVTTLKVSFDHGRINSLTERLEKFEKNLTLLEGEYNTVNPRLHASAEEKAKEEEANRAKEEEDKKAKEEAVKKAQEDQEKKAMQAVKDSLSGHRRKGAADLTSTTNPKSPEASSSSQTTSQPAGVPVRKHS